jgi:hypothetical protein
MKKLLILSILLSSIIFSCKKEPEPEPEEEYIRAYCNLYHFIPQMGSVLWEIDEVEVPDEQLYAQPFQGSVILEAETEEIVFTVKHSGTKEILVTQLIQLEQDKYYNVIVGGSPEEPEFLVKEFDTSHPGSGMVKFQVLHSIPDHGPIDLYMGDTIIDKRVITSLDYLELSDHFEVFDFDVRASMITTAHSDEYNPDSVLLRSIYNDLVESEKSYLSVVAHHSYDTTSELTYWLYSLALE